jgi:hypothetical protein
VKTPPEPRPATILGPYGEGYCRVCRFIEPLTRQGVIAEHARSNGGWPGPGERCKGSFKAPPKDTPYFSRLSAFRATPRKVECPMCHRQVTVLAGGRISGHNIAATTITLCGATLCEAGGRTVTTAASMRARGHGGERG